MVIHGLGIERDHCFIDNNNGLVTIYPQSGDVSIDGVLITEPTCLSQGILFKKHSIDVNRDIFHTTLISLKIVNLIYGHFLIIFLTTFMQQFRVLQMKTLKERLGLKL